MTPHTHIPCAAGNNLHTDCAVSRHGDLIEVLGHVQMLFTPEDATRLAVALNRIATEIRCDLDWELPAETLGAECARPISV